MNRYLNFFLIVPLLFVSQLKSMKDKDIHKKIMTGVCTNNSTLIQEAYQDYSIRSNLWPELINCLICVNSYYQSYLTYATKLGHLEAVKKGHTKIVEMLLDDGANIEFITDRSKPTVLSYAAKKGKLDLVRLLVEKGASITRKDKKGRTAIHAAATKEIADFLKEQLKFRQEIINKQLNEYLPDTVGKMVANYVC